MIHFCKGTPDLNKFQTLLAGVCIADSEQINASWERAWYLILIPMVTIPLGNKIFNIFSFVVFFICYLNCTYKNMDNLCVKSVRIRSFSGQYFPTFGLNTERHRVSLHISSECRKIRTRKTPNMDTFCAVLCFAFLYHKISEESKCLIN